MLGLAEGVVQAGGGCAGGGEDVAHMSAMEWAIGLTAILAAYTSGGARVSGRGSVAGSITSAASTPM